MKKLFLSICTVATLFFFIAESQAQIRTPAPSPSAKFTQTVGLTDVTIEYSRPGVKDRTIFAADGLVPFGKVWRTGANAATKITFGDDVKVGGKELKKGAYAILTIPKATEWTVQFHTYESGNWSSYTEKEPAASVSATLDDLPFSVHNFVIAIGNLSNDGGDLQFIWDKTVATVPLKFEVDSKVVAAIEKTLSGPTSGDYYAAANYYHSTGKDLNKALMWVQKATKVENPRFWQVRREALILADLGRKEEAIATAKKSMELAKAAGNEDYVRMNEKSIAEWSGKMKSGMK